MGSEMCIRDRKNRVLQDKYDDLIAEYDGVEIGDFGPEKFYDSFEYADTAAYIGAAQT